MQDLILNYIKTFCFFCLAGKADAEGTKYHCSYKYISDLLNLKKRSISFFFLPNSVNSIEFNKNLIIKKPVMY